MKESVIRGDRMAAALQIPTKALQIYSITVLGGTIQGAASQRSKGYRP